MQNIVFLLHKIKKTSFLTFHLFAHKIRNVSLWKLFSQPLFKCALPGAAVATLQAGGTLCNVDIMNINKLSE